VRRRALLVVAFALGGLMVGLWLGWPDSPPGPQPVPHRPIHPMQRATAAATDAPDTGSPTPPPQALAQGATPALSKPDPPPPAPVIPNLEMGSLDCRVDGPPLTRVMVSVVPSQRFVSQAHQAKHPDLLLNPDVFDGVMAQVQGDRLRASAPLWADQMQLLGSLADGRVINQAFAIEWHGDQATCTEPIKLEVPSSVTLSGQVRGLLPDDRAWVEVCQGRRAGVQPDGSFQTTLSLPDGPCDVRAVRMDGALWATGAPLQLDIDGDGSFDHLVLDLPRVDIGGMGARIEATDQGVRLMDVQDGSPAAEAGLMPGETVVAADGMELGGMSTVDAISHITGPVDSEVTLTVVDADGKERDIVLRRGFIQ